MIEWFDFAKVNLKEVWYFSQFRTKLAVELFIFTIRVHKFSTKYFLVLFFAGTLIKIFFLISLIL